MIPLPNIAVAAALLPSGKVLTWSSNNEFTFEGDIVSNPSQTQTALFDPITQRSTLRVVTNTLSDTFCPGITTLSDGRILVNGGSSSHSANIYDPQAGTWSAAAPMNVARGYNADVMLTDGSVLTLGGSWSGLRNEKIGEVWSANTGWTRKPGISALPVTAPDPEDKGLGYVLRGDNHLWLFAVGDGLVFHAGPSAQMNWMTTYGDGAIISAGNRADDAYSMNGQAVMYDVGKILKTGGAPAYQNMAATAKTYVIDINDAVADLNNPVVVRATAPMAYPRAFANGVVLPTGHVLIVGGRLSPPCSATTAQCWFQSCGILSVRPSPSLRRCRPPGSTTAQRCCCLTPASSSEAEDFAVAAAPTMRMLRSSRRLICSMRMERSCSSPPSLWSV